MSRHKQKARGNNRGEDLLKASDEASGVDGKKAALLLVLIMILAAAVFSNTFQNSFVNWDDDRNVYENKYLTDISLQNLKVYFTKPLVAMYTPLVYLSFALDYQITGLDPAAYHATNLLLHLVNVALVFFAVFLLSGRPAAAAVVSLVFAVHPVHAAAVTPISVRSSLLYTMFYLGAFIVYLKYVKQGWKEKKYLPATAMLFALSLLSKSAAVVFPLLMLLTDYYYGRKFDKKTIVEKIPFFALSLLFGIVTLIFREDARHLGSSYVFSLVDRVFLTTYAVLFYPFKLMLPLDLSAYYPYPEKAGGLLPLQFYLSLPILLAMAWGLFNMKKHRKVIVFGVLFYLVHILLVLKVLPMGNEMVCDRYAYLPSVGLFWAAAMIFWREKEDGLWGKPAALAITGLLLAGSVAVLSWMAYTRNPLWKDSITFHTHVLENYQNVATAYNGRGLALWEQKAHQEALADFDRAIALEHSAPDYYSNRGNVKIDLGDHEGALRDFDKAIALNDGLKAGKAGIGDPDAAFRAAAAFNNRAALRKEQKQYDSALLDYGKAIEADPEYSIAYYGRASVHMIMGDLDRALKDYDRAIALDPYRGASVYYQRAYLHMMRGDLKAALRDYDKALELEPGNLDALTNRGYVRHLLNDSAGAIKDYTQVVSLSPAHRDAYHNRGLIKWTAKDAAGACADWRMAARLGKKDSREAAARYCGQ